MPYLFRTRARVGDFVGVAGRYGVWTVAASSAVPLLLVFVFVPFVSYFVPCVSYSYSYDQYAATAWNAKHRQPCDCPSAAACGRSSPPLLLLYRIRIRTIRTIFVFIVKVGHLCLEREPPPALWLAVCCGVCTVAAASILSLPYSHSYHSSHIRFRSKSVPCRTCF